MASNCSAIRERILNETLQKGLVMTDSMLDDLAKMSGSTGGFANAGADALNNILDLFLREESGSILEKVQIFNRNKLRNEPVSEQLTAMQSVGWINQLRKQKEGKKIVKKLEQNFFDARESEAVVNKSIQHFKDNLVGNYITSKNPKVVSKWIKDGGMEKIETDFAEVMSAIEGEVKLSSLTDAQRNVYNKFQGITSAIYENYKLEFEKFVLDNFGIDEVNKMNSNLAAKVEYVSPSVNGKTHNIRPKRESYLPRTWRHITKNPDADKKRVMLKQFVGHNIGDLEVKDSTPLLTIERALDGVDTIPDTKSKLQVGRDGSMEKAQGDTPFYAKDIESITRSLAASHSAAFEAKRLGIGGYKAQKVIDQAIINKEPNISLMERAVFQKHDNLMDTGIGKSIFVAKQAGSMAMFSQSALYSLPQIVMGVIRNKVIGNNVKVGAILDRFSPGDNFNKFHDDMGSLSQLGLIPEGQARGMFAGSIDLGNTELGNVIGEGGQRMVKKLFGGDNAAKMLQADARAPMREFYKLIGATGLDNLTKVMSLNMTRSEVQPAINGLRNKYKSLNGNIDELKNTKEYGQVANLILDRVDGIDDIDTILKRDLSKQELSELIRSRVAQDSPSGSIRYETIAGRTTAGKAFMWVQSEMYRSTAILTEMFDYGKRTGDYKPLAIIFSSGLAMGTVLSSAKASIKSITRGTVQEEEDKAFAIEMIDSYMNVFGAHYAILVGMNMIGVNGWRVDGGQILGPIGKPIGDVAEMGAILIGDYESFVKGASESLPLSNLYSNRVQDLFK